MRAGRRASWVCGIAALAAMLFAGEAHAQDDFISDWLQQPYMTGDWGGMRTKLEKEGISLRAHYISETPAIRRGACSRRRNTPSRSISARISISISWQS